MARSFALEREEASLARGDTSVTVDVVLLTIRSGGLSVLLVNRATEPFAGCWALPGGFVRSGESLGDAARRELRDKTGVDRLPGGMHLEQLKTYGDPERDPRGRVVSVSYLGLGPDISVPSRPIYEESVESDVLRSELRTPRVEQGVKATETRFWTWEELQAPDASPLAFDHKRILTDAVERARAKLEYAPVASAFVDEPFTLADLRRIYEAVWGVSLDAPNFRRKVLSTPDFVSAVGETAPPPGGGRPAELYRRGSATLLHPAMLRPV